MRLTDVTVRNLIVPTTGTKIYVDDQITGFGVRVTKAGAKAFVLTYGTQRERVTIGRYPAIGLADARTEAKRILAERTLGKLRPKRLTFEDALDLFIETRKQKNRPKTAKETEALLRKYFKKLHSLNLEDIRAHHISDITDDLSKRGLQSTAAHAHTAVKTFLKWCSQRQYLTASPISDMEKPTLPKARERVLLDDELRSVWIAAGKVGSISGDIIKLLILTGQRRMEIGSLKAEWCSLPSSKDEALSRASAALAVGGEDTDCEVSAGGGLNRRATATPAQCTITLPATITKNKRTHMFPIGLISQSILMKCLPRDTTPFLFPGRGSNNSPKPFNGWSKAKEQIDKKVGDNRELEGLQSMEPWTLHDLRRTYATNLQRLDIRIEVIEALLNHVSGTRAGIVGVYQRHRYEAEMRAAVTTFEIWFTENIAKA